VVNVLQKLDPTQFVRVYGRPVKIHLDPAVAMTAEGPQIMSVYILLSLDLIGNSNSLQFACIVTAFLKCS